MSTPDFPESPCVGLCRMDGERRYCMGCGRTLSEIAGWSTMSVDARRAVLALLPERVGAAADDRPRRRDGFA